MLDFEIASLLRRRFFVTHGVSTITGENKFLEQDTNVFPDKFRLLPDFRSWTYPIIFSRWIHSRQNRSDGMIQGVSVWLKDFSDYINLNLDLSKPLSVKLSAFFDFNSRFLYWYLDIGRIYFYKSAKIAMFEDLFLDYRFADEKLIYPLDEFELREAINLKILSPTLKSKVLVSEDLASQLLLFFDNIRELISRKSEKLAIFQEELLRIKEKGLW